MEKFEKLNSYRHGCKKARENFADLFSGKMSSFKNHNNLYDYGSESSLETPYEEYKSLSPSLRNISKTSWSSEDKSSSSKEKSTKKQFFYNFPSPRCREIETTENTEALANENLQLKVKIQDLEKKIEDLSENLQKKEKELRKANFDKEIAVQSEEEKKKILEEAKRKNEILIKENSDLRMLFDKNKQDRREMQLSNKDLETKLSSLKKSLKIKDEAIFDLKSHVKQMNSKTSRNAKSSKLYGDKLSIKHFANSVIDCLLKD